MLEYHGSLGRLHGGRMAIFYKDGWVKDFAIANSEKFVWQTWRAGAFRIVQFIQDQIKDGVSRQAALDKINRCAEILKEE